MTSQTDTTPVVEEPPAKKPRTMSPPVSPSLPAKAFQQASLLVQRLSAKGRLPTRGSAQSAGYDLYSYVLLTRV